MRLKIGDRARRKSDGKIGTVTGINTLYATPLYSIYFGEEETEVEIPEYEAELIEPKIPLSTLKETLDECLDVGYINEYAKHRIIEIVKHKSL